MTIRPATAADLASISAIQSAAPEAAQWDCADYLRHSCLVAEESVGLVVGFVVARQTAPGEHEILNLAVQADHRKKGVGRALLKAAVGPQETWFLEVRESNQAAIALYLAAGFTVSGRRPNYYREPAEGALVMHLVS